MPKGYTTRAKIENYLLITIDPTFYTQVDQWIASIEAHIEKITGRVFVASPAADDSGDGEQRKYDGDGTCKILIDDAVEISEVKLDEDQDALDPEADPPAYYLYPLNAAAKGLPYTRIELNGSRTFRERQSVLVTGRWGYSETAPADIELVATVLVAGIINFSWNSEGEVQSMTVGRYSVTYKSKKEWQDFEKVQEILNSYKKFTF